MSLAIAFAIDLSIFNYLIVAHRGSINSIDWVRDMSIRLPSRLALRMASRILRLLPTDYQKRTQ